MDTSSLYAIIMAAALGALVGMEREIAHASSALKKGKAEEHIGTYEGFGGIRSYALIAVVAALCSLIDAKFGGHFFVLTGLAASILLIAISHAYASFRRENVGITSEFAAIVVYLLGAVAAMGQFALAFIVTIGLMTLLSAKGSFQAIRSKITQEEFGNAMKFALIAFVVLPLLPNAKFSILDTLSIVGISMDFDAKFLTVPFFNPYGIWFFVVIMSAVEFAGYVLSKVLGTKGGILASGAVGGLVSSTAVTAAMTAKSKEDAKNVPSYVVATLVASSIMLVRVVAIVAAIASGLLPTVLLPAGLMFFGLAAAAAYFLFFAKKASKEVHVEEKLESPFKIMPAIKFAGFVVLIKFVSALGIAYQDLIDPRILYYGLGAISGLADVDAISLDMAGKFKDAAVASVVATTTILIAVMSNNFVKASLAYRFWDRSFGRAVAASFGVSMVLGVVGILGMY